MGFFNRKRSADDLNSPSSTSPPIQHAHVSKKPRLSVPSVGSFMIGFFESPAGICNRIRNVFTLHRTYEAAKDVALGSFRYLGQVLLGKDNDPKEEEVVIDDHDVVADDDKEVNEVIQIASDDEEEEKEVIQDYITVVDDSSSSGAEAKEVMQVDFYDDQDYVPAVDISDDSDLRVEVADQVMQIGYYDDNDEEKAEEFIQIDDDDDDDEKEAVELIQIDDDDDQREVEELIQIDDDDDEHKAEELILIDDEDEQEAKEVIRIDDDDDEQEAEEVIQINDNDEEYMLVADDLSLSFAEVDVFVQKDVGVHSVIRLDKELWSLGSPVVSDVGNAAEKDVGTHGVIRLDKELQPLEPVGLDNVSNIAKKDVEVQSLEHVASDNVSDVAKKDVGGLGVTRLDKKVQFLDSPVVLDASNVEDNVAYMKLYKSARRRDGKLKMLQFEIELNETLRQMFLSLLPQTKPKDVKMDMAEECLTPLTEKEEQTKVHEASVDDCVTPLAKEEDKKGHEALAEDCFTPLTEEEEMEVHEALSNPNELKILVSHQSSNIEITAEKFRCLMSHGLLNNEVINVYLELLKEREKRNPQKLLTCHFFNTFFYKKLLSKGDYDYQQVRRWTTKRKLGYSLMDCDKIFVPIHQNAHWTLGIINKKEQKFQYLDSLGGFRCLDVLRRYYVDEVKDKNGKVIDVSSWESEHAWDVPKQDNAFDCGMFMIKYVDFHSRDLGLCFGQEHMPYFRRRTAKELLRLRAE